jgi:putative ABC transport system permease protein
VKEALVQIGPILRAMLRNRLRFGLIAAQIAVTLAIVANCVALILDARLKMSRPPAYDDENILFVYGPIADPELSDDRRRDDWVQENLAQLRRIPGVRAATCALYAPWAGRFMNWHGRALGSSAELAWGADIAVDEHFPEAFGAEIDEGRWFSPDEVERGKRLVWKFQTLKRERGPDGKAREPIVGDVVITRAFGRFLFGEGPLVGKVLEDANGDTQRIIGVVRRHHTASGKMYDPEHAVFYAGPGHDPRYGAYMFVRSEPGRAVALAPKIEAWLQGRAECPTGCVHPVPEMRDRHFGPQRMTAALMGLLVILLLFVTSVGVAGLTSFSVMERTRQIGTRRALGATTGDIVRHFLTEAGLLTTIGLVVGTGLAVGLNIVLLRLYTDAKLGAGIVAASALVLLVVGLGAALPPALRSSRTSPAIATRNV